MALDGKVCYFTFGRFQPPTTVHKENFDGVKRAAQAVFNKAFASAAFDGYAI